MIEGRKVVGSAQLRQGSAFLQHGSILLEDNHGFVVGLTRGAIIAQSSQRSLKAPGTAQSFRRREVAEAVTQAAGARWPGEWNRGPDPETVLQTASSLYSHYRSAAWTWAR